MARKLLTKDQRKLLDEMIAIIRPEIGQAPPPIETELPGMDPMTQQAYADLGQFGTGELGQARQQAIMQGLSGESQYEGISPEFRKEQLRDIYVNPMMREWEQNIAPGIESYFAGSGAYRSGDISRAISQAGEGVGIGAARELAGLTESELQRMFLAGEQARDRQMQSIGLGSEEEKSAIRAKLLAGETARGVGLEQANYSLMKELRNTPFANPALGLAPLALGTQAKVPSTGGGEGGMGGIVGSLLGGVLGGIF